MMLDVLVFDRFIDMILCCEYACSFVCKVNVLHLKIICLYPLHLISHDR
jgi:hypothetical protein